MSYFPHMEPALGLDTESPAMSDSGAPRATEPGAWILSLSKPSQYAILALFALYAPSAIGQGPLFDPYLQLLAFVGLVFGSLLISTTNLAGPLRYGYHSYGSLATRASSLFYKALTTVTAWTPLPFVLLALLPWFRTWFFMGAIPLAWQFIRGEHQQEVSQVKNCVDEWCSEAQVAANKALSDASAAKQFEHDLEQKLRAANFYEESSVAWTGIDTVSSSSSETSQDSLAMRARTVATEVDNVKGYVSKAIEAAQATLKLSDEARNQAVKAKTAVEEGRMKRSLSRLSEVEKKREEVKLQSNQAASAREDARTHAQDAYQTWLLVREQHRERVAEIAETVKKACISADSVSTLARLERETAERQERQAEALAAAAARNAYAAHGVRLVDFYRESAAAWAKLSDYTNAVSTAVDKSRQLVGVTSELQLKAKQTSTLDSSQRGKMIDIAEHCSKVLSEVKELEQDCKIIRDKTDRFKRAGRKAAEGRARLVTAAAEASSAATSIAEHVRSCMEAVAKAVGSADEVAHRALDANGYASVGDMVNASTSSNKVAVALAECRSSYGAAVKARGSAQKMMSRFFGFRDPNVVRDPDPEGDDTSDQEEEDDDDFPDF